MNRTHAIAPHALLALGETGLVSPQGWDVGGKTTAEYMELFEIEQSQGNSPRNKDNGASCGGINSSGWKLNRKIASVEKSLDCDKLSLLVAFNMSS
jgi:hypothetical protein